MDQYTPNRRTRRKPTPWWKTVLTTTPLLLSILLFGIIYFLTSCFGLNRQSTPAEPASLDVSALPTAPVVTADTNPADSEPATTEPSDASAATDPAPADSTEPPATEPEPTEPAEKTFTSVEADYFDDALFIGDSRTDGLRLYDPPSDKADFYCGTSMTIFGVLDSSETVNGVTGLVNVLQAKQYGKVYIMFGINECGYDTAYFLEWYKSVVDTIRLYQPNAIIYIQSILYVTQAKENSDSVFSSANLKEKNAGLQKLANGEDIFYLEVNDALNDGTDHLPAEYTGDGAHLKANYYYLWRDYLYQHAIVDEAHPYPL